LKRPWAGRKKEQRKTFDDRIAKMKQIKKKQTAVLAVDIGNTTVHFAAVNKGKVLGSTCVLTSQVKAGLRKDVRKALQRIAKHVSSFECAVVCSVVPQTLKIIEPLLKSKFSSVKIVGRDIKVPIKNCYQKPRQVGQDRLVSAYAARELFGLPALVIDLGTAITMDVISGQGHYLGGVIIPGLTLSARTLFERTALLPKVKIRRPGSVIGRDTESSILSGLFYGYGEMLTGMIKLLKKKVKGKARVVLTGGYADLMRKYISAPGAKVEEHLVIKGLDLLIRCEA